MQVAALFVYPIKSCGGIAVNSFEVSDKGPRFDREWMIVKPDGSFLTARQKPKLLTASVSFTPDNKLIEITLPEQSNKLYLPINECKAPLIKDSPPDESELQELPLNEKTVRVWRVHCPGEDVGDAASKFFSDFLGQDVRVVRSSKRVPSRKMGDDQNNETFLVSPDNVVSYADAFPYLLASISSLEDLNKRIGTKTLGMERFRPNIVISGSDAWEEDSFLEIKIGGISFSAKKACGRCKMTTIDQSVGEFDGKEPLQTMQTFRRQKTFETDSRGEVMFGKNLIQIKKKSIAKSISIGDPVLVTTSHDISHLQITR